MKRLVFDFDGTLFGEGVGNERWLALYELVVSYKPAKIWLFSNGSKWQRLQSESAIAFEHIDDMERRFEDLNLVESSIQHALEHGYKGLPENAGLVKRCPQNSVLVDDLASTWVAVANSNPETTFTPEQFMERVQTGELSLQIDNQGYLVAVNSSAA